MDDFRQEILSKQLSNNTSFIFYIYSQNFHAFCVLRFEHNGDNFRLDRPAYTQHTLQTINGVQA